MSVNDFQMIVLPPPSRPPTELEMEPVFQIDDDIYRIPKKPSAGLALGYLEKQSTEGPDSAVYWMMVQMLGEDGYQALKNHPALERSQMDAIIQHIEKRVLGGIEGNPSGDSRHRVSAG